MGKVAVMKMPLQLISFLWCILQATTSICQNNTKQITGIVQSDDGKPVAGASVLMMDDRVGRILSYSISKRDGRFELDPLHRPDSLILIKIDHIEYESWSKLYHVSMMVEGHQQISVNLIRRGVTLKEITVKASPLPYRITNDTTEFRANAYKSAETRKVEDLLKNIQGFQVSDDGRIYFQGREIEKLLLEGEDMTDRNYRLLSKNLNATLVDRVQVIDNYHADKLMRAIDRSGKIAVNLTVDSAYRDRISGTIGIASAGRRQLTDVSTVYPGRTVKWLTFTNYNQVGLQTGTQLSDDRTGENYISESRGRTSHNPVFEPMQIPPPLLDVRYARDNEDVSSTHVLSMRDKKGHRFRLFTGVGQGRLQRSSDVESRLYALSGNAWVIQQQQHQSMKAQESLVSFHFKHDHRSNQTGDFGVNLMRTLQRQSYVEQINGALTDSLSDNHHQRRMSIKSTGHETWSMKFGPILKLTYGMDLEHMNLGQQLKTRRLIPILSPTVDFSDFHQIVEWQKVSTQADISMHGRSKNVRWTGGLNMSLQRERHELSSISDDGALGRTELFLPRSRMIRQQAMVLHGNWQSSLNQKTGFFLNGELGMSPFNVMDSVVVNLQAPYTYRLTAGLDHKLSMLSSIRLQVFRFRQNPTMDWFHVGPMLMADGQVRFPAASLVPETSNGVNLSMSRLNLPKSFTGLIYFSMLVSDGTYRQVADRKPAFTRTTYMPFDGQRSLFASGSLSKHFPTLRFKYMTDASVQRIDGDARLDEQPITNQYGRFSIQQRVISAFPIPWNVEISYTASRHFNRLSSTLTGETNTAQWQHVGYARLNGRFGEKGFFSMIYGHRILMSSTSLKTLDLYGRWKTSKSLFISMTGHNLTDVRVMEQRMVSLNATTDQRTMLVGRYILLSAEWSF
jgi:hypothetical protein